MDMRCVRRGRLGADVKSKELEQPDILPKYCRWGSAIDVMLMAQWLVEHTLFEVGKYIVRTSLAGQHKFCRHPTLALVSSGSH
jgi:hypothetical protein